ncbi:hypothetical protein [Streptomyces collinus]|uniref:hypothetical protein n=1 Tax=Streptomyces collinus TaxID=42684 RepID=UPI003636FB1E
MDEMTEVRRLRAYAPVPDQARLAPGRARLTEAARDSRSRPAFWRRRRFALVAVVAAVTAVAVAATLLPGGKVTGHLVETAAGRQAIALDYAREENPESGDAMHDQWLVDPQTHRIVGMRLVEGGKVVGGNSTVTTAVVNRAGDQG